ncbi:MAG: hypothetical protein ABUL46_02865 [Chitinophaga rupis]
MRLSVKILSLFVLLLSCTRNASAQFVHSAPHRDETDSIKYYKKVISDLYKHTWDSLRQSEAYLVALNRLQHHTRESNGYTSFTLFGGVAQASYDGLNRGIAQSGFPAMNGPQHRFGLGASHEYHNRVVLDFYYLTFGLNNTSKKGDESVKCNYYNFLQFNFGYDFIKSRKINLYPYAGLSARITDLSYSTPTQVNPNPTSIADIIQNSRSESVSKFNLSYQAGIGVDFVVHEGNKGAGTMVFLRGGTDGIFGSTTFKIEDAKYDPKIKQGAWVVEVGFKFFGRE